NADVDGGFGNICSRPIANHGNSDSCPLRVHPCSHFIAGFCIGYVPVCNALKILLPIWVVLESGEIRVTPCPGEVNACFSILDRTEEILRRHTSTINDLPWNPGRRIVLQSIEQVAASLAGATVAIQQHQIAVCEFDEDW